MFGSVLRRLAGGGESIAIGLDQEGGRSQVDLADVLKLDWPVSQ